MIIAFEGIDGSGKNTQVQMLVSFLKKLGLKHRIFKFPTKNATQALSHLRGKKSLPQHRLAEIFISDILTHKRKIEDAAEDLAILDRYLHSTLAYQGAKIGYQRLRRRLLGLGAPIPDLVFVLDIDPLRGTKRKSLQKKPDRFESDPKFLSLVRKNYLQEAKENFMAYKFVVVDASRPKDEVFTSVITHVEPLITKKTT